MSGEDYDDQPVTIRSTSATPIPVPQSWLLGGLLDLGMTSGESALFLALWAKTGLSEDGLTTMVGVSEMAKLMHLTRETTSRALTRLQNKGFIHRIRRHGNTAVTKILLDSITTRTAEIGRFQAAE